MKSCGTDTYKWLLHKTDMGSNQVGELGMLRGINKIQSGKHFAQCLAKYQVQFIN